MKAIIVYIDGECPMCVAGANRLQRFDTRHRVRFVNAHDPRWAERVGERFTPSQIRGQMQAEMPDGTWRTGYFAWAAIFSEMRGLRWLGLVMRFPLLYGVGPAIYQWIANHRLEISRVLRLPPPCDENGVCRLGQGVRR
ncbi:hypothetical protein CCAX7_42050 [Capsulimonas corticalis]|uniref:Uncharacterized protein n=1 Tax=Capsulimonas corticalis TaxID=2219043 RepID=A0A402CXX5_9BACT|nr:DUF393 domain-containing protein [Capsulimonas corticalis]BDI32154.1 hypothetical protein CCAX7_42050 [Capsulimonas corticalis]